MTLDERVNLELLANKVPEILKNMRFTRKDRGDPGKETPGTIVFWKDDNYVPTYNLGIVLPLDTPYLVAEAYFHIIAAEMQKIRPEARAFALSRIDSEHPEFTDRSWDCAPYKGRIDASKRGENLFAEWSIPVTEDWAAADFFVTQLAERLNNLSSKP